MTTRDEISNWIKRGRAEGATHMIVAYDSFDWDGGDYPIYIMPGGDVREEEARIQRGPDRVMEVYWIEREADVEKQLNLRRSFTYGPVK